MCGISGWIDLERNLNREKNIIVDMTATLKNRGPDAEGIYYSAHAQLGHRRLIVVDPAGGVQPMSKTTTEGKEVTITYNGELYNTVELRDKLQKEGYTFDSYSDTEVLLNSYLAYGTSCVEQLNGIYAFAVWDETQQKLFLARDRLGVKPLFYFQKGSSFCFASEIKSLLAHPEIKPIINDEGLMEIFGLGPARTPGSGVFRDIKELRPGHLLTFSKKGLTEYSYWQLKSSKHQEDFRTTAEHVRYLFLDIIDRQLISDVPVCTFLSGGLDSSAITAVTANIFKKKNRGILNTFSIDYQDNDRYFTASDYQPDADSNWINVMLGYLDKHNIPVEHHNIILKIPDLAEALLNAMEANDLPGMADIDSSLYLFTKEVKQFCTVALSGECADEIFGGYPWFRVAQNSQPTTFPWSKTIDSRVNILSHDLKKLPLTEFVQEKFNQTIREVPVLQGERDYQRRHREIFYLNLKWFMVTLLTRKDRMSMANSLEVRVPFADHRLVEYLWNIPWEMKYYQGIEKGLLRVALSGILPEKTLQRRKSPYPKTHHPAYTKAVITLTKEILADPNSPLLDLINTNLLAELTNEERLTLTNPWFGQLMAGPQLLAYLIQLNYWLKNYCVKIKV